MTVLEDLHEVVALGGREGLNARVIEDEQVGSGQLTHEPREGAIAAGDAELLEELPQAQIAHRVPLSGGLIAEGAGEIGLAGAGLVLLPLGVRIGGGRQGAQGGAVDGPEELPAAVGLALQAAVVERLEQRGERLVEGSEAIEAVVAQPGDPARYASSFALGTGPDYPWSGRSVG